ncbi:tyrosine-type recombinase/integrase [Halalkalibacter oceani]|uniref:Tyrosine-type recombinase/integrase n=1 Tax=Halalkalibacter oceani TaxID=1653776 RepID=A0A9X2IQS8_9BACI|nr:tyrosine-type recombinase/integrase [Halalkalibacter oceani]MCM3714863.1 tyrosine-type recombinase/integrase [Halalkalibacter oceani]
MEYVDPIRKIEQINQIKQLLKERSSRDYLLFVIGINTGLRINQLLHLTRKDVLAQDRIRDFLIVPSIDEAIYLNTNVKRAIEYHLAEMKRTDDYLFASVKTGKPISRQQAYRIISQAAQQVGIPGKIGTHTLRKTFGYHAYRRGIAISFLQKRFKHKTRTTTLDYIGVTSEDNRPPEIDVDL